MATPSKELHNLLIARSAAKALSGMLSEKVAHAAYEFITGPLLDNPRRVGTPLGPLLAPAYSARRGDYRGLYLIDEATHAVKVTAIRHRTDAYRS